MKKSEIKCSECEYCSKSRYPRNTRSEFTCKHPDSEYIWKYYREHNIRKMEGFLGFGKPYNDEIPVKTSPGWCPRKKG